jgi:hypothetical protein
MQANRWGAGWLFEAGKWAKNAIMVDEKEGKCGIIVGILGGVSCSRGR